MCRFLRPRYWVAGVALALGSWPGGVRADDDLVKDVARRNRAAVESIHTLSCQYSKARYDESGNVVQQFGEVQYWRSGPNWRKKWTQDGKWVDAVCDEQQIRTRTSGPGLPGVGGLVAKWNGVPSRHGDPWLDTLVASVGNLPKNPKPRLFEDKLTGESKWSARLAIVGGTSFVVVESIGGGGYVCGEYWFDPRANYLICREVVTVKPGAPKWPAGRPERCQRIEVTRFAEPVPGVFFPAGVTKVGTEGGNFISREVGQVKNLRVNAPLPADIFSLDYVPGDRVSDQLQGKTYTVGSDGKSETKVMAITPPTPALGAPGVVEELTETKAEPRSVTSWLLPLSAGLVVLGVALICVRRRANRLSPA